MELKEKAGLSGNQLKIIALIAMTIDHIGVQCFPSITLLRIIGRLSFPIFAYMIAEGCQHTHHRKKYLLSMSGLALICQLVYYFAMGSLYMCVLVTFSLSILLIYALDLARNRGGVFWAVPAIIFAGVCCLTLVYLFPGTDFSIDYGIWGVLMPVFVYLGVSRKDKLALLGAAMILLSRSLGGIQWFCLAALIPLSLYNGRRGKAKLKHLFYIYYPLHLVVIYGLSLLL